MEKKKIDPYSAKFVRDSVEILHSRTESMLGSLLIVDVAEALNNLHNLVNACAVEFKQVADIGHRLKRAEDALFEAEGLLEVAESHLKAIVEDVRKISEAGETS